MKPEDIKAPPTFPSDPCDKARRAGAVEALDFAIQLATNFSKDELLARLSNLRQGYRGRK